ncbi:putative quinol monooxygenase [Subtercola endophyticus]|uniref:putative quinol monooxygenase n=1 Tax=Subtercola endophyticus TaxID=2895559 RepID=UPI001E36F1AC|nr:putative quinol monooxygenase [Subtercola endophyticus]UFS58442.1 antibiotic biosynthesis monooxygenase [Subtercola endophyticus]
MTFSYTATLRTQPGRRDDVIRLLLTDQSALAELGCLQYLVGTNAADPDVVYVSERWVSDEAHAASLQLPSVQAAIADARPMLTGDMTSLAFEVVGGLGA